MRVSELYGPGGVAQGEGALLGIPMPFLRLAGCNLSCSWCDSAYTWQAGYEYTDMTPEQVVERLLALAKTETRGSCGWVSITGGEPTIYASEVYAVCALLRRHHMRAIIETNGLRPITAFDLPNVFVSCSPKLPGSGQDSTARRAKVARLVAARRASPVKRERTQYKFVIAHPDDLEALPDYCAEVGIDLSGAPGSSPVYVQPDGYITPIDSYLDALAWLQGAAPRGVRVTPQVHRLIHGPSAKGV